MVYLSVIRVTLIGIIVILLSACSGSTLQTTPTQPVLQVPVETALAPGLENTENEVLLTPSAVAPEVTPMGVSATETPVPGTEVVEASPTVVAAPASFPDPGQYTWETVATGLQAPVGLANAGDTTNRLFVIEKAGRIVIIQNGSLLPEPFLDIEDRVGSQGSEQGLLGLAFHPGYRENGYFYVNYTDRGGDTVIARFNVSPDDPNRADPGSEQVLLQVQQPYANHNGGSVVFGPDRFLYLGLGDGGAAGDPQGNGQTPDVLLGKILRIDVDSGQPYAIPADNPYAAGGGSAEVWAIGLRNPWRFSFDRQTGDLYLADVGQNQWEEVNYLPSGTPGGANFGWDYYEGTHSFEGTPPEGLNPVMPVAEYSHTEGCSITGGSVYRGSALPEWQGIYLYSDFCTGHIWGLFRSTDGEWNHQRLYDSVGQVSAFGEDEAGEIYLVDYNGQVLILKKK